MNFLKYMNKNKLLVKFRNQNSILPKKKIYLWLSLVSSNPLWIGFDIII